MKTLVDDAALRVTWGPLFSATIPRSKVASVRVVRSPWWGGIGVHKVNEGGWLVNTRPGPAVEVRFTEPVAARTLGLPIRPRRLLLGSSDPDRIVADLGG